LGWWGAATCLPKHPPPLAAGEGSGSPGSWKSSLLWSTPWHGQTDIAPENPALPVTPVEAESPPPHLLREQFPACSSLVRGSPAAEGPNMQL